MPPMIDIVDVFKFGATAYLTVIAAALIIIQIQSRRGA